jgi:hypothetical protein
MNITRRQCLQAALVVIALVFLSLPILMAVWPSGWIWLPRQTEYEQMMIGVYQPNLVGGQGFEGAGGWMRFGNVGFI